MLKLPIDSRGDSRCCKNVVVSKQVKNTVAVLAFAGQQKGYVTCNTNNSAISTADKERLIVRVINFLRLSFLAKNEQSNLVLVRVLVLESKGP